jgi:hypothetical protein
MGLEGPFLLVRTYIQARMAGFRFGNAGRVTRLSGNVRQPNHSLANQIAADKAERRPGAGEEWLAVTKHDGVEVELILINKTKVG